MLHQRHRVRDREVNSGGYDERDGGEDESEKRWWWWRAIGDGRDDDCGDGNEQLGMGEMAMVVVVTSDGGGGGDERPWRLLLYHLRTPSFLSLSLSLSLLS